MDKNQIAQTIVSQLGGWKFKTMTGCKFIADPDNGLRIVLPSNFAQKGINRVSILLTPADLYDVIFSRARGVEVKEIRKISGVFFYQLQELFTETTGLDTHL